MTLDLTIEEINALLNLMGKTATESGFFPLMVKIKEQAEAQLPKEPMEQ
jgi:hypothetical protein